MKPVIVQLSVLSIQTRRALARPGIGVRGLEAGYPPSSALKRALDSGSLRFFGSALL